MPRSWNLSTLLCVYKRWTKTKGNLALWRSPGQGPEFCSQLGLISGNLYNFFNKLPGLEYVITQVSPKSKSFDFQARRISIFMFIFQKGFFSMWVKSKGPGKGQKPLKPNQIIFTGSLLTQELIHWKKKKIHHNLPPSKTLLWMKANPAPKKYAVYWLLGKHLLKGKSQHSPETVLSDQGRGGTGSRGWGGWDRPTNQAESSGKGWGPQMRRWAGIGGSSPVAPLASPGRWGCLWHAAPHKVLDHQEKTSYPPPTQGGNG